MLLRLKHEFHRTAEEAKDIGELVRCTGIYRDFIFILGLCTGEEKHLKRLLDDAEREFGSFSRQGCDFYKAVVRGYLDTYKGRFKEYFEARLNNLFI